MFKFSTSNYTVIEGAEHLLPILRLNELDEAAVIRVQGCDGSPLPGNFCMTCLIMLVIIHMLLLNTYHKSC